MSTLSLLEAAARTYALVCYSDGRMPRSESDKFAAFAAGEASLARFSSLDIDVAWKGAVQDMAKLPAYADAIAAIASSTSNPAEAEVLMRAGQKALVADGRDEPQENGALHAIAVALKLDPDRY